MMRALPMRSVTGASTDLGAAQKSVSARDASPTVEIYDLKHWTRLFMTGLVGLTLSFTACDSDDSKPAADTTTADTMTADTTAPADTMTADTTASANACMGTEDLARIQDTTKTNPSLIASACGTQVCLSLALTGDFAGAATCANTCMNDGNTEKDIEAAGLSTGCTSCYVDAVLCAAQHCLAVCAADGNAQPCVDCRGGDNDASVDCTGNFHACSGLPR